MLSVFGWMPFRCLKLLAISAALLCWSGHLKAEELDIAGRGTVIVEPPAGWTVNGEAANSSDGRVIGYAIAINPSGDLNAKCLVTFAFVEQCDRNREQIREELLAACQPFVAGSVEKKATLNDFSLKRGYGAYCLFTDASLVDQPVKKGDFKVMGSGMIQLSAKLIGVVSIFADERNSPEFNAMVQTVNALELRDN
jgi:hypothetical protein